jgi:hypothetical protein
MFDWGYMFQCLTEDTCFNVWLRIRVSMFDWGYVFQCLTEDMCFNIWLRICVSMFDWGYVFQYLTEDMCFNSNQVPNILLLCKASTPALCQIQPFIQYLVEVKREAALSASLKTEVKNEWNHTSTLRKPSWPTQRQLYTGWSKSLCAPDDYSTKNTQKILNTFNQLPW